MLRDREEADRTLFVGNLDSNVKEETLYELFLQAGPLTKVNIPKDKEGNLKSFGFVCFKHSESVPYAISLLNGIRLYGRPIKLHYRYGSSHTTDSHNHLQGPEKGLIANTSAPWMAGAGNSYAPPSMANMDNGFFSQAHAYFCSMMNPLLAFQSAACALMSQVPPCYKQSLPWSTNDPTQPYADPGSGSSAGPSGESWGLTNPSDSVWCRQDTKNQKRAAEARDTTSDDTVVGSDQPEEVHKPKKRKSKRRR